MPPAPELVRRWADRRRGVGFDQLLLVDSEHTDGRRRELPNLQRRRRRGRAVRQRRALPRALSRAAIGQRARSSSSPAGAVAARVESADRVSVDLGVPDFRPSALPFLATAERDRYRLDVAGATVEFGAVSMGNPHAVIAVEVGRDARRSSCSGPAFQRHASFPQQRERRFHGAARAIGASACAFTSAASARRSRAARARRPPSRSVAVGVELGEDVEVELPGGVLEVNWPGPGSPLWQTGPTTAVYEGYIEL